MNTHYDPKGTLLKDKRRQLEANKNGQAYDQDMINVACCNLEISEDMWGKWLRKFFENNDVTQEDLDMVIHRSKREIGFRVKQKTPINLLFKFNAKGWRTL